MKRLGGWVVWITGLPGSGKSTVTQILNNKLNTSGIKFHILSIDSLRKVVTPKPTYSESERDIVYGALVYSAFLLSKNSINVLIDATGNKRNYRRKARSLIKKFIEVYIKCPIEICIKRESVRIETYNAPTMIYDKGFSRESTTVPGIGSVYEEPLNPEIIVHSDRESPERAARRILQTMKDYFGDLKD